MELRGRILSESDRKPEGTSDFRLALQTIMPESEVAEFCERLKKIFILEEFKPFVDPNRQPMGAFVGLSSDTDGVRA